MKRPIVIMAVFAFTAAVCANCFKILTAGIAGVLELAVFVYLCRKKLHQKNIICISICVVLFIAIYIHTCNQINHSRLENVIDEKEKENCLITGKVYSVDNKNDYIRLQLKECFVKLENIEIKNAGVLVYTNQFDGKISDIIKLEGVLSLFKRPRNEGEFDSRTYYHSIGLDYSCEAKKIEIISAGNNVVNRFTSDIQNRLNRVYSSVLDDENAGIIASVILGDKQNLNQDVKKMYQTSGIAHLLAISGLHISVIGMTFYRLSRKVFQFMPAAVLSMAMMTGYLIMTGNAISAVRAVIMFLIAIIAEVLGRTYDFMTAMSMAAIFLILEDGRVILNLGFQLSFCALLGICFIFPRFSKIFNIFKKRTYKAKILDAFILSISIQLATIPIVLYSYYQFPVWGFLLNIIVVPMMSLVMVSGIISGIVGIYSITMASFFIGIANYILDFYKLLCNLYERIPGSVIVMGKPQIKSLIIYILILLVIIVIPLSIYNNLIKKWVLFILLISVIQLKRNNGTDLMINMIDVGQGDCIFVQDKCGFTALFDGGSTDVKKVGERRIMPYLKSQGVNHLDYIFISHSDMDHISGIIELIESVDNTFSIENIILPDVEFVNEDENFQKLIEESKNKRLNIYFFKSCDEVNNKRLKIKCIHPDKKYVYDDINDYSAVYILEYDDFKMLFMGDAGNNSENNIMKDITVTDLKNINVLKIGHHGSQSASSKKFLEITNPQTAIISCGIDNKYGHPHKNTLDKLNGIFCEKYVTSETGAINIKTDGNTYTISAFLQTK